MQKRNWTPTPKVEWVRKGDRCISAGGMRGEVLNVTAPKTGLPSVTARWENGYVGRLTITNVRREAR